MKLRDWIRANILARILGARYAIAVGAVAIASLFNLVVHWSRDLDQDTHYFALLGAVLFAAVLGGRAAGFLATALAGLSAAYFSLAPRFSIQVASPEASHRLLVFLAEGALVSLVGDVLGNAQANDAVLSGYKRYLAMPLSVGTAVLLKLIVVPHMAEELPFAFNYAAVSVAAWLGGAASGVAATLILAGVTRYFFLAPFHSLNVSNEKDAIRVGLFVCEGLLLSLLNGKHTALLRLVQTWSARARQYRAVVQGKAEDTRAMRTVSRDTIWEWQLERGEISRTPSWQDALSSALPERETFSAWMNRIHPDDQATIVTTLTRALVSGREECQYGYRLLRPDGEYAPVSDHAFIVRDPDWKAIRVIGRSADLMAARPPRDDGGGLPRMFEESPASMIIVDTNLRIVFANSSSSGKLRVRRSELLGAELVSFIAPSSRACVSELFAPLLQWKRLSVHFEHTLIKGTGHRFPARISATLVTEFQPGFTGCLVIIEDLT